MKKLHLVFLVVIFSSCLVLADSHSCKFVVAKFVSYQSLNDYDQMEEIFNDETWQDVEDDFQPTWRDSPLDAIFYKRCQNEELYRRIEANHEKLVLSKIKNGQKLRKENR